jgi:hypothetical protein
MSSQWPSPWETINPSLNPNPLIRNRPNERVPYFTVTATSGTISHDLTLTLQL